MLLLLLLYTFPFVRYFSIAGDGWRAMIYSFEVSIDWGCVWMRSGYWCYSFIGLRLRSNQQVRRGYETYGSEPSWSCSPLSYITITTKEIHLKAHKPNYIIYIHEYCTVPFDRNKKINSLNNNLFDKIKQPKIVAESIIDAHNIQLQSYKVKVEKWSSASANFFLQKRTIKLMWIF